MTDEESFYTATGKKFKDAEPSQLFGKPCFKINGKPFVCFFNSCMVFKLSSDVHAEALSLEGSQLFDPSAKKRPMKEWVQVEFTHKSKWEKFAGAALKYVEASNK